MSSFIDKKYINLISGQLNLFKWKSSTLANCRCPICGDSQKNKTKCRGYFYEKKNSFFYRCHNCGYGCSVKNFLDKISPSLVSEYQMETFEEQFGKKKKKKRETPDMNFKPFQDRKPGIVDAIRVDKLPENHPCLQFVQRREIPLDQYENLYFTKKFNTFVKKLIDPEVNYPDDERLVIPFVDNMDTVYAAQGRRLVDNDTAKYYTAKPSDVKKLWYNEWKVDPDKPVIVVEGPIDSMFISNSIAMVGSGAITELPDRFANSEIIYALDNEPRNNQIVSYYENLIKSGQRVCLWPSYVKEKDVNDMVLAGKSKEEVEKIILTNSFSDLEASLKLKDWKKI
tara:strand:+ start:1872 stop:2891 length:1020 start_codon:yes stop_codon:yes gene_type:complete